MATVYFPMITNLILNTMSKSAAIHYMCIRYMVGKILHKDAMNEINSTMFRVRSGLMAMLLPLNPAHQTALYKRLRQVYSKN